MCTYLPLPVETLGQISPIYSTYLNLTHAPCTYNTIVYTASTVGIICKSLTPGLVKELGESPIKEYKISSITVSPSKSTDGSKSSHKAENSQRRMPKHLYLYLSPPHVKGQHPGKINKDKHQNLPTHGCA
ncbi:hypothetical protein AYI68_g753 [Smittium mucronatum]|uniref:Uncharacterized protein n=1 Tax=Smittium mucronatum TaxID=133383 RepID=A0A1R0H7K3_9FUNG|nr:hypothetical protein AYI68_g753 [Smittium mucronatum]